MSTPTTPKPTVREPKRCRTYDKELKQEAVKLAESIGATQAAQDLGIDRSLVSAWRSLLANEGRDAFRCTGNPTAEQAKMVRQWREIATLRMERDFLKKAAEFFGSFGC